MKATLFTIILILATTLFSQTPGKVVDSVRCKNNKDHTYAIYLPSNYMEEKKWPIIYFFEPAARGRLPVDLYADVAEELGYILACTNNSRNGTFNDSFEAADALFLDVESRFSIDNDKVILSGFSGGSRLSLSIAVISEAAYGVIGVGATQPAIPAYMVLNKKNFKYVGLVGARDMNYLEHKSFRMHLNVLEMDNLLIVSNLKHRWASPNDFRLALLWMNKGNSFGFQQSVAKKILAEKDSIPLSDVILLDKMVEGEDFVSVENKTVKKTLRKEAKIVKKEQLLKRILADSIDSAFDLTKSSSRSINWLKKQAQKIKIQKEKAKNVSIEMMYDRLLNYMGASCYETSMIMKSQGFTQKAIIGISIWGSVYGSPIYAEWLKAKVYAADNDSEMALQHLEAALKAGRFQKKSIFNEPDFNSLIENESFKNLIDRYYN